MTNKFIDISLFLGEEFKEAEMLEIVGGASINNGTGCGCTGQNEINNGIGCGC